MRRSTAAAVLTLTTVPRSIQSCWAPTANSEVRRGGAAYKREMAMLPTVDHVTAEPVPDFEIVSWQTNDAKGDMPPEEFIAYCRRVVPVADQRGSDRR